MINKEKFELELKRLNENLENTNQQINQLFNNQAQLMGAIAITQKFLQELPVENKPEVIEEVIEPNNIPIKD